MNNRYRKMAEVYKIFATEYPSADFSEDALKEMFNYESEGIGNLKSSVFSSGKVNGYALGKSRLNLQVTSWKEDLPVFNGIGRIYPTLFLWELYEDQKFPHWWLNKVFKDYPDNWKVKPRKGKLIELSGMKPSFVKILLVFFLILFLACSISLIYKILNLNNG